MLIDKTLSFKGIMRFAGQHLVWLTVWMSLITAIYSYTHWRWMGIPWLPLSIIGTAVAFYVGFKNNQAYDRLWEGRKIWGGIVNSSRAWSSMIKAYLSHPPGEEGLPAARLDAVKREMIFRHIAWLYILRNQLLIPTSWEHVSLGMHIGTFNQKRRQRSGVGLYDDDVADDHIRKYLPPEEYMHMTGFANAAAQLIDKQAQELARLRSQELIDDFKHIELQRMLNDFCDNQGKAERIKKFPLPRQYGSLSFIFVCLFIFLLPFGIVGEFNKLGTLGIWLAVSFGVLVGWIYVVMELIGDYSENPFEGLPNDVPMLSICRSVEIDLLQMLGETKLPPAIEPRNGVLM